MRSADFINRSNDEIIEAIKKLTVEVLNVPALGVCWIWQKAISNGYGRTSIFGKVKAVHRVMYELVNGPIPDGFEPDHLCRVKACCRPSHLEAVTHQINGLRSDNQSGKNSRKTHCKNGHELTSDNIVSWRFKKHNRRECLICNQEYQRQWRKMRN